MQVPVASWFRIGLSLLAVGLVVVISTSDAADPSGRGQVASPRVSARTVPQSAGRMQSAAANNLPNTANDDASDRGKDGQPLSPQLSALGAKIRRTLAVYQPKHLNARDNTCWEVMHNLIAFGPQTEIFRDGPGGQTVNAMGWLCWSGRCQGQPLVVLENNHPHALYGVGLQGHDGQYLAMLGQWKVRPESPMHVGGKDFTVADFIEEEKLTCQSGTELTFKLFALSHYLPSDATWTSRAGEQWDIPKLIKAEIAAPVNGAACGGTHRLEGISNAVKERAKQGKPIDGEWARAAKYISDYQRYTLSLQNPDGSFSTEWFKYAADRSGDIDRKVQTTGHMLEFLVWSLSDDELRDPRVVKATNFLADLLLANPDRAWSIGPEGHALHALVIYHQRMFTQPTFPAAPLTAAVPMPVKAKTESLSPNPREPECDVQDEFAMPRLPTIMEKEAAGEVSKSDAGDNSDGCTDSIANGKVRVAMRDKLPPPAPASTDEHPSAPIVSPQQ